MRKILGIPITLFVLGLLVLGTATAVLVKYFSNTVTHTVDVSSPLEMTGDTALSINIFGGENIVYSITTKNLANISIDSYPVTELVGPSVWTGEEFLQVLLVDDSGSYNITSQLYIIKSDGSLIPFADADMLNATKIKLFFDSTLHTYTRPVGFVEQQNITIITNPAIMPGIYTINSCQLYLWNGDCY